MRNLLKADFFRIFKDKLFLALCISVGALSIFTPLVYVGIDRLISIDEEGVTSHLFCAVDLFGMLFSLTSVVGILVPVLTSIILNRDFKNGVIRNKLTSGKNRETTYLAALIENLILEIGFTIVFALIGFIISATFLPFSLKTDYVFSTELLHIFFIFIINICVLAFHCSVITFFIYATRSLALAIIIPYVIVNICSTITSIGSIIAALKLGNNPESQLIGLKIIEIINFYGGKEALLSSFMSNNFSIFALTEGVGYNVFDVYHVVGYTVIPLVFACLLNYLGIIIFRKKDLK